MLEQQLFEEYRAVGKIQEALLVGQNLLNRYSGNMGIFRQYFDLLIMLSKSEELHRSMRQSYAEQAATALAFFSENAEMSEGAVSFILQQKQILEDSIESIRKESAQHNDEVLDLLRRLVEKLGGNIGNSEYDETLERISQLDAAMDQELSPKQQKQYADLTRRCTSVVEKRTRQRQHEENVQYNLAAIAAYEKAFNLFKNGQGIESHYENLKGLFQFDASRLSNETLVYYNHIYSFILSKMDDKGKYMLTKYAIMSEKRR